MLKIFLITLSSLSFFQKIMAQRNFAEFVSAYDKRYSSTTEYFRRKNIFVNNLQFIDAHNNADRKWKLEMNRFGDLEWSEFKRKFIGESQISSVPKIYSISFPLNQLPSEFDWVSRGAVTKVKNQGQCGSCWAFSATGALEGLHYISEKTLISFSEQDLVDCSTKYGNNGCNGGLMDLAFKFVEQNGICTEKSYPYNGTDGKCQKCKSVFKIKSFEDIDVNNESALQQAVFKQPVSVAIEADQPGFQFYSHGVFDGTCGTNLDHGVLVVGWGTVNGTSYWKVKNSWGSDWGDKGYIMLARNIPESHGQCGIAMQPSVPTM